MRIAALEAATPPDYSHLSDEDLQAQIAALMERLQEAALHLDPNAKPNMTVEELKAVLSADA